jgi:hypothetical protein
MLDNYTEFKDVVDSEILYKITFARLLRTQAKYYLLVKGKYYYEEFLNLMKKFIDLWVP